MNLQPMYPPPQTFFRVFCSGCGKAEAAGLVRCDLDDVPGTFYCASCAALLDPDLDSPAAER